MLGHIYVGEVLIGNADFKVVDATMGAISGFFEANENYQAYKGKVQKLVIEQGIANVEHLNFKISLGSIFHGVPNGGIGIIDLAKCEEIEVEAAGLDGAVIDSLLKEQNSE